MKGLLWSYAGQFCWKREWRVSREPVPTVCWPVYSWLTPSGNLALKVCACFSLGTFKTSANSRLFSPQITATSTSRWPETGVVATRSQLRALHTCGQEPVPATESEGAVCALRWRWVGQQGVGTGSGSHLWNSLSSVSLVKPWLQKRIEHRLCVQAKKYNEPERTIPLLNAISEKQTNQHASSIRFFLGGIWPSQPF